MMPSLQGRNQVRRCRKAADALASEMVTCDGVVGIVYIGGLVRGFADRYSDVDIVVFLDRNERDLRTRARDLRLSSEKQFGVDIDLEVHLLEEFRKWGWNEADRWEFSRAEIVFDPRGEVRKVFDERLAIPRDFWIKRIAVYSEYLKWYCCPPKQGTGTISEAWTKRGDPTSAHYCLSYGVELLVKTLFALNREYLPAPKWRLFYSYALKWLPVDYEKLIKQMIIIKAFSAKEYDRRCSAIRDLWAKTTAKIEEQTGLSMAQLSQYYAEKILHQTAMPLSR